MSTVRYAIIGFGGISQDRIAPEGFALDRKRFSPLKNAELVAATSHSPSRQQLVEKLGLKWYPTVESLLSASDIDAVFIGTNNATHFEIAKQCLNAGKHVILEKPMTINISEAEELVKLASTKNLSLAIDHMMIYNAYNIKAAELVKNGSLGKVNDSCFHMEFGLAVDQTTVKQWRCASADDCGGPIGDLASHCLYSAEFVFDSQITEIACIYYPKTTKSAVEDGAYIKYKMANGLTGSVKVAFNEPRGCFDAIISNMGYEIYGDKAVLRSYGTLFQLSGHPDEPQKIRLEVEHFDKKQDNIERIQPGPIQNIYAAVIVRHADSILNNKRLDGSDGLHSMKLIEACRKSAANGGETVKI